MTDDERATDPATESSPRRATVDGADDSEPRRTTPETTDPGVEVRTVKRALARLARGPDRPDPDDAPAAVVEEAVAATGRIADAAAFVAAGGDERLATAVERLEAAERTVPADRGAAVLADLAAFRDAAAGEDAPSGASDTETASGPATERL